MVQRRMQGEHWMVSLCLHRKAGESTSGKLSAVIPTYPCTEVVHAPHHIHNKAISIASLPFSLV
uniref:Uncharacterized protein MANES_17G005400 n=1 Tax=Rhizophora mucronata TaxID=61149 RepID=A0A2P2L247_RHIMU